MQETVRKPPATMVRKQLLITPEQNGRLAALAAAQARSESEIVREALEAWLTQQRASEESWKQAWQQAAGMWADRKDLDEFYAKRRQKRRDRRERMNKLMAEKRHR